MEENWGYLPEPVILKIFHFLSINDRKNASLSCKNWSNILNCASLWRSVFCLFNSEPDYDKPYEKICKRTKCLPLVRHCATWIQELTIKFYKGPDDNNENGEIVTTFLKSLTEFKDKIQLRKFSLELNYYSPYEENMLQILQSLIKFLGQQNTLISFRIKWDFFPIFCTFILDAIAANSGNKLKLLEITRRHSLRFHDAYHRYLGTLNQLHYLTLPYETLGKRTMRILANNCPFLSLLTISLNINEGILLEHDSVVTGDTWKELSEKLPKLRIAIEIGVFAVNSEDMKMILPPTIPLIGVKALKRPLNLQTILHLYQFKEKLRSLELLCCEHKYPTFELVNSCRNLTMLKFMTQLSRYTFEMLMDLKIKELRSLKRVSFLLILEEELKHEELVIKEVYRNMWSSNQYSLEIFTNFDGDIYKYIHDENFCQQV